MKADAAVPPISRVLPPGPKGKLLTGNLADFGGDPLGFLEKCVRDHGDIVPIRLLKIRAIIVNDSEAIDEILVTQTRNFRKTKGIGSEFMGRLFGNGLLTSEGSTWARQRRMTQPALHRAKIAAYAPFIVEAAERMTQGWKCGETRSIHSDLTKLIAEVVMRALVNSPVPPVVAKLELAGLAMMERLGQRAGGWKMLIRFFSDPEAENYSRMIEELDAFLYGLIKERRAGGKDAGDVLSTLIQARDENGLGMTDREIRDELATLMAAGLDTTVLALSWCCYLLARHPSAAARLEEELKAVLGGRSPKLEDLPALRYTDAVVKETMRLYPPAWLMAREAVNDCVVGGYPVASGTWLIISQWLKHRDGRVFAGPDEFRPERWLEGTALPKFAYFPFGGGQRICAGNGFASMEAPLGVAAICQRFHFECEPDYVVPLWPNITLQPKGGIHLRVRQRSY